MTIEDRKVPVNEARQELRQLARDLNFELRELCRRVDEVRSRLYVEAQAIRREGRAGRRIQPESASRDAITVFHGAKGRATRKGHD